MHGGIEQGKKNAHFLRGNLGQIQCGAGLDTAPPFLPRFRGDDANRLRSVKKNGCSASINPAECFRSANLMPRPAPRGRGPYRPTACSTRATLQAGPVGLQHLTSSNRKVSFGPLKNSAFSIFFSEMVCNFSPYGILVVTPLFHHNLF